MALSFIFDTSKGETPESVARKRALAAAIMGQAGPRTARNAGEGIGNALSSIGQGIQVNVLNRRADTASQAGQESAASAWNPLLASMGGQQFPAAPTAPGGSSGASASADPAGYRDAIASIESAGDGGYSAVGPTNPKLGRALGRYQIMEANIGPWSKAAIGREVTPREFLANPQLQDAIFDHRFGSYVKQFGDPALAAQAWFAGPGGVGTNRKDVLGTSVPQYAQKFTAALGGRPAAALATDAMATGQPVPPAPTQVASLDSAVGMVTPDANSRFTPQAGQQIASDPKTQRVLGTMMNPQPMGGAPMPMQGMPSSATQPPAQPVQVAQAQSAGQDLSRIPVAAGGTSGAYQPGQGPSLQMLMQAASNPWLTDSQKSIIGLMLKQKMAEQDPARALEMEYKRAQINKLTDPNARDKFGNSVIWGQDADGKWVAMQPSSGGGLVPAKTPEGISLSPPGIGQVNLGTSYGFRDRNGNIVNDVPIDNAGKAAASASGKAQGEAAFDLPRVEQNAQQTLDVLERMKTHPGREGSTGFIEGMLPSRTSDQVDFQSLADQTQGQSFLQAFQMLKGAGQITDIEGRKATEAISRLGNQRLSDADYLRAISDLEDVVKTGLARARVQAGQGSGPAPSSGGQKRLKFNPATGELE